MKPRRISLAAIASIWSAVALVAAGLVIGLFNEKTYQAGRAQALTAQAEVLSASVEPALVFLDRNAAGELVVALKANPQVAAAAVYDAGGGRVAELHRKGEAPPRQDALAARAGAASDHAVTAPVIHEGKPIGLVYLRNAGDPPAVVIQRHAGVALLLLTAVLLVAMAQSARAVQARAAAEAAARAAELAALNADLRQQVERREAAELALHQAQKMETLGQLTGGMAHDFNNLLQTVQGALDLIAKAPSDLTRVERWSRIGLEAAERGARLTAQLLAFSRSQKLELKLVEASTLVGRLSELLPNVLGAGIEVSFEVAEEALPVVADAVQLELAILNLCINARDAMPNGGRIIVGARSETLASDVELPPGDYVRLSVADNGVGMPQDVQAKAFEPFFTTKGVGKGTGLGLAQVYGIAKQSGGIARIDSAAGAGTMVSIILPQCAPGAADRHGETAGEAEGGGSVVAARVLVIDDDAGVRAFICDALTAEGLTCIAVSDGAAGLERLRSEDFDLLIVDYAMPGITGAEVATAALAMRPDLPIIVASGYAESSALETAMGRSVELLRKPFDSTTLLRRVRLSLEAQGARARGA
jgi:signal transduction histidine kinase